MRCIACDKNLNDFESTRKDLHGKYIDMCNACYSEIKDDVLSIERQDLSTTEEITEELADDLGEPVNYNEWTED
jgi:NAD-dependent SIR2 family protein deacetylase